MDQAAATMPNAQNQGGAPSPGYDDLSAAFDDAIEDCENLAERLRFENEQEATAIEQACLHIKRIKDKRQKRKEETDRMNQAMAIRAQLP